MTQFRCDAFQPRKLRRVVLLEAIVARDVVVELAPPTGGGTRRRSGRSPSP